MRVLVVSTSYPRSAEDWRGRFIADLVAALPDEGVVLRLWSPPGPLPVQVDAAATAEECAWLDRLAEAGGIASRLRAGPLAAASAAMGLMLRLRRLYRREAFDVAHVNWLQNAIPLLGTHRPALIGVLGSDYGLLGLPGMAALIKSVLAGRRAMLAPNAPWMAPRLQALFGEVALVRPLPFGVAPEWFTVERRPQEHAPWLAVTRVTQAKIGDLFDWGEGLFDARRPLVLLGPMQEAVSLPSWVDYRGATHPVALRQEWFPRAAGLISLSRHDEGRPQVMIEAMAAGLPIVASDQSAHRDLVSPGANGWIAASRDAFANALDRLSDPAGNRSAGEASRDKARREIGDWCQAAERFRRAYREVSRS